MLVCEALNHSVFQPLKILQTYTQSGQESWLGNYKQIAALQDILYGWIFFVVVFFPQLHSTFK